MTDKKTATELFHNYEKLSKAGKGPVLKRAEDEWKSALSRTRSVPEVRELFLAAAFSGMERAVHFPPNSGHACFKRLLRVGPKTFRFWMNLLLAVEEKAQKEARVSRRGRRTPVRGLDHAAFRVFDMTQISAKTPEEAKELFDHCKDETRRRFAFLRLYLIAQTLQRKTSRR